MIWLYFFMGVTAAWVFMVLVLFGVDIMRNIFFPSKKQKTFNDQLIEFWKESLIYQNENLIIQRGIGDSLSDIQTSIVHLKKRE